MSIPEDLNPIEDCTEDTASMEAFRAVEIYADLERALAPFPEAMEWLRLVEQGYKPHEAAKMLGKNWWWVEKVQRAARQVFTNPL